MKKIITLILVVAFSSAYAQAPHGFNYQAVARDAGGVALINQAIGLQISLLQGSPTGSSVYTETHTVTSNNLGLLNLVVGNGTPQSGSFMAIDWANGPYYIEISMDVTGGTTYVLMGTQQLLSVPYALYAASSGTSGAQGATGVTGATGADGVTGATGNDGANGIDGATGATGAQGIAGIDGVTGSTGLAGADGTDGAQGAQGAQGADGVTGATGSTGANGATGATGSAGTNGATGSTGATGVAGTNGITGATGTAGTNGTNGATGSTGATGTAGTNGTDGVTGATGATGTAGTNGTNGVTGSTGATGVAGANGTNGSDGATGATGVAGATGPQGAQGVQGPQGVTGATGTFGVVGTTGQTVFHNGTDWVATSNLYNNGTNVAIGTATPNTNAALEISSTTGAFLLPRMTTAQRDALTPEAGMMIYNTTRGTIQGYHKTALSSVVDQSNTNVNNGTGNMSFGQSFVSGLTGNLNSIVISTAGGSGTATLVIRSGAGTGGTILHSQSIVYPGSQEFLLTAPVPVDAGSTYTFELVLVSGSYGFNFSTANPYSSGSAYFNGAVQATIDLYFQIKSSPLSGLGWNDM